MKTRTIKLYGARPAPHAEGERLIMALPHRVTIWTAAEWRALPKGERPSGASRVGAYWIDLAAIGSQRARA